MSVFEIEGVPEFNQVVNKLIEGFSPEKVEPILVEAADIITQEVRKNIDSQFNERSGKLRSSPATKVLSRRGSNPAAVISAIDRKLAPHAHFLEKGTSRMGAKPFFRPAVDAKRSEALNAIGIGISKLIREATP